MNFYPLHLLGACTLLNQHGQAVALRSRKQLALLAYLISEHQIAHSRETLLALLWPDEPQASAQNNLRFTLSQLRGLGDKIVPPNLETSSLLQSDRHTVQISPSWVLSADINHFHHLLEARRQHNHSSLAQCQSCQVSLSQAVQLYQGEFLQGLRLGDCPAFEEWLFIQRERLHVEVCQAFSELADCAEMTGDLVAARKFVQRQIELDPLREPAYRQQMRILTLMGERSAALAVFERCRSILNQELGLDPEPETLALHMQILKAELSVTLPNAHQPSPLNTAPNPAQIAHPTPNHNLPQQLSSFIGREQEITQIHELLQAGSSRLISLVGPGGIGKTRLALQIASANQHLFAQGVCFVPLVGVQGAAAIPGAIIDALGGNFAARAASPTSQLLQLLSPQQLLLVIDNFEHLIEGVDLLLAILQSSPNITLIVTTREQLNCQAEDSFRLEGLATPSQVNPADAGHYAAVRLFCERAYRLNKNFKLTAENCSAVVKICQLVEGMPLAIELATTWLDAFNCADLAAAIAQNQSFLATTQRDLPTRHRSMQAVFDYSWQLLTAREQRILSQLALCQGRFSIQIATQLTGASLIDLTSLRYKSLLRIADAGYYDLHSLIRGFAVAMLDCTTQTQAEERLATNYLQHLAEHTPALDGATPQAALNAIGCELDNVHQVWQWAVDQRRFDLLVAGAAGLGGYYTATGRNLECELRFLPLVRSLLEQPATPDAINHLLCVRLLDKVCHSLIWLSKLAEAGKWAQTMVEVAQTITDQEYVARGLVHSGKALDEQTNPAEAVKKYQAAVAVARQLDLQHLVGLILIEMSHPLRDLGRGKEADGVLSESLAIQRSLGNRLAEQRALLYLSVGKREEGDFQADRDYLMGAIDLLKFTANRHVETRLMDALGINYGLVGNYTAALEYHEKSRQIAQEIGQPVQQCHTLRHKCTAHRKQGNLALAEECGLESLRLALVNKLPNDTAHARLYLGFVWLATGKLDEAAMQFQQAYDSWRTQGYINLSQEALVGLATVDLRNGNSAGAAERIAPVVPTLIDHVPVGVREPYEMQLACYEILTAMGDARAKSLLATAYNQLQTNINKVSDRELLRCFWDAPVHGKILTLWQSSQQNAS